MTAAAPFDVLPDIATCIDAIGTQEFPQRLGAFCAGLCACDNIYITALFEGRSPVAVYGNHAQAAQTELLQTYLDAAYLLDPFVQHFAKRQGDQVLTLNDIAPDDFKASEYYARFFKQMGLTDECAILLHLSETAGLFISLGIERAGVRSQPAALRAALPVIAALARRHWASLSPENPGGTGRLSAQLNAALENFGTSILSPREGEITRMILQGHSSKAIARRFDNSPETIKVHRKRIYAKLGVAGQSELLSLLLDALRRMPAGADGDPVTYLAGAPPP